MHDYVILIFSIYPGYIVVFQYIGLFDLIKNDKISWKKLKSKDFTEKRNNEHSLRKYSQVSNILRSISASELFMSWREFGPSGKTVESSAK